VRLNHVTLPSVDPERSLPFYEGLGLTAIVLDRDHDGRLRYVRLIFPDGDSTLSLERESADRPAGVGATGGAGEARGGAGPVLYFECDELDARVAAMKAAGYAFVEGPETKPWLWREARLRDPDGHELCLFRAGFYRRDPPWRIASVPPAEPGPGAEVTEPPDASLEVLLEVNNRGYVDAAIPSARDLQITAYLEGIERGGATVAERAARLLGPPYTGTLVAYAERMASLTVRTEGDRPARLGALALALAWGRAPDVRAVIPVLGLLYDGIRRAGGEPARTFREVADLCPGEAAPVLRDFLTRPDLDEIAEEMGFAARRDRDGFRYRRTWGAGRVDGEDGGS
jgi:catechol 2,3-dioxygenase-like lactoylglutathione lyase family enzyme